MAPRRSKTPVKAQNVRIIDHQANDTIEVDPNIDPQLLSRLHTPLQPSITLDDSSDRIE